MNWGAAPEDEKKVSYVVPRKIEVRDPAPRPHVREVWVWHPRAGWA